MDPSPWVVRFSSLVSSRGDVLDIACGAGRHTRLFLARGHRVVAVDRDLSGIADLADHTRLERVEADLEAEAPVALAGRRFAAVVVTNYLHRPLLPALVAAVDADGVFIYETFSVGNERLGRPKNPHFLLRPGELLDAVRGHLRVIAYEDVIVDEPSPAAIQRVCALGPNRAVPVLPAPSD
ncbi:MAG: class I SAM-dependent methyltransferase [Actinomycetota bacterium]